MTAPLMPRATAVWLVENTTLTFRQISNFCEIHELEIQAIADGDVNGNIRGLSPLDNGQLTWDEIHRCEGDKQASLKACEMERNVKARNLKAKKILSPSQRQDKPSAIIWVIKNYPMLKDSLICKLIGTTKSTIESIRKGTHSDMANIRPKNPVTIGLCTEQDIEKALLAAQPKPVKEKTVKVKKVKAKKAKVKKTAAPKAAKKTVKKAAKKVTKKTVVKKGKKMETTVEKKAKKAAAPKKAVVKKAVVKKAAVKKAAVKKAVVKKAAVKKAAVKKAVVKKAAVKKAPVKKAAVKKAVVKKAVVKKAAVKKAVVKKAAAPKKAVVKKAPAKKPAAKKAAPKKK